MHENSGGDDSDTQSQLTACQLMVERARAENRVVTREYDELKDGNAQLNARVEELRLMYTSEKLAFQRFMERHRSQDNTVATKEKVRDLQQEIMHLQSCIGELQQENDMLRQNPLSNEWTQLLRKCREMQLARVHLNQKLRERNLRVSEVHDGCGIEYAQPKCLQENQKLRRKNADLNARLAHFVRMEELAEARSKANSSQDSVTLGKMNIEKGIRTDESSSSLASVVPKGIQKKPAAIKTSSGSGGDESSD
jgi:cell division septum initiation protein DivIVA